jgi:hypothetical protein
MATSELLAKWGTIVTPTITLASLANGAGRVSAVIDNTTVRAPMAKVFLRIKTGASAPTVNTPVKVYLICRSNGSPDLADDARGTVDAATTVEPAQAELLGSIIVTAATATTYEKSFNAYDLSPKYSIEVWNAIGNALDSTAGSFVLEVEPITLEGQ